MSPNNSAPPPRTKVPNGPPPELKYGWPTPSSDSFAWYGRSTIVAASGRPVWRSDKY
jgi:hypothetical protein